jgi:hypothetical protein
MRTSSLHLAASDLLLALNLVEGELKGTAGGQPGLEKSELNSGWRGAGVSVGCSCHILTVLLPKE